MVSINIASNVQVNLYVNGTGGNAPPISVGSGSDNEGDDGKAHCKGGKCHSATGKGQGGKKGKGAGVGTTDRILYQVGDSAIYHLCESCRYVQKAKNELRLKTITLTLAEFHHAKICKSCESRV